MLSPGECHHLDVVKIELRANRMEKIGTDVAGSGGAPTGGQVAELNAAGNRLRTVLTIDSALLRVAVVLMASARYQ
jgi:hypothetical protein